MLASALQLSHPAACSSHPHRLASGLSSAAIRQYSTELPKWTNTAGWSCSTVNGAPRNNSHNTLRAALTSGVACPSLVSSRYASNPVDCASGSSRSPYRLSGAAATAGCPSTTPSRSNMPPSNQTRPVSICTCSPRTASQRSSSGRLGLCRYARTWCPRPSGALSVTKTPWRSPMSAGAAAATPIAPGRRKASCRWSNTRSTSPEATSAPGGSTGASPLSVIRNSSKIVDARPSGSVRGMRANSLPSAEQCGSRLESPPEWMIRVRRAVGYGCSSVRRASARKVAPPDPMRRPSGSGRTTNSVPAGSRCASRRQASCFRTMSACRSSDAVRMHRSHPRRASSRSDAT